MRLNSQLMAVLKLLCMRCGNYQQVANKADLVPAGTVLQSIGDTVQQQQELQQRQLWKLSCRTGDGVEVRT
jgi:hypothetical protein